MIPVTFVLRVHDKAGARSSFKSIKGRQNHWQSAIRSIEKHPIAGVGVGAVGYSALNVKGISPEEKYFSNQLFLVHNQILQWGVEMGIFGIFFGVAFYLFLIYKIGHPEPNPIKVGATCALTAMMVAGLADVPVNISVAVCASGTVLFHLLLPILLFPVGSAVEFEETTTLLNQHDKTIERTLTET